MLSTNEKGLSSDRSKIHTGSNSGYQAINLAYHLGAKNIFLLGYDMKGHGDHFFGKHKESGLSQSTNYSSFAHQFRSINPKSYGIEIFNCTKDSGLDAFPKITLDCALEMISD